MGVGVGVVLVTGIVVAGLMVGVGLSVVGCVDVYGTRLLPVIPGKGRLIKPVIPATRMPAMISNTRYVASTSRRVFLVGLCFLFTLLFSTGSDPLFPMIETLPRCGCPVRALPVYSHVPIV